MTRKASFFAHRPAPFPVGWGPRKKYTTLAHLITDGSVDDLVTFGAKIGLKPSWIHINENSPPHFDITLEKHGQALREGAISDPRRFAAAIKEWRERNIKETRESKERT